MEHFRQVLFSVMLLLTCTCAFGQSGGILFLSKSHAMIRVHQGEKYILLPVEEKADGIYVGLKESLWERLFG